MVRIRRSTRSHQRAVGSSFDTLALATRQNQLALHGHNGSDLSSIKNSSGIDDERQKGQKRRHVAVRGIDLWPGRAWGVKTRPFGPASNVHAPLAVSDACLATSSLRFTPQLRHTAPPALPQSAASASYAAASSQWRQPRPHASRSGRAAHLALAAAGGPELPAIYCGSWQFGRVSQSFLAR